MTDLIERLRGSLYACNAIRGYLDDAGFPADGDAHGQLAEIEAALTEAAAALEAAQEDAERLDSGTIRIIERDEFGMQHTTAYSGVDLRAAIDQARGNVGKEDSND